MHHHMRLNLWERSSSSPGNPIERKAEATVNENLRADQSEGAEMEERLALLLEGDAIEADDTVGTCIWKGDI